MHYGIFSLLFVHYLEFFHHTLWIIPGVREGKALMNMLRIHPVFGAYTIVNVAGDEDEESVYNNDALREVQNAIGDHPEDTYTITLSCGKLTTGVTIRPWTAVLYLAGSKNTSAQSYMQTIFRVQSPAVIGGRMKTECYVFDFAPDRTLKIVAEAVHINARAGATEDADRKALGEFLNFCPIISCKGTQMKPYDVNQMMQQLKRVYVDKVVTSGFEDGHLYSRHLYDLDDNEIALFNELHGIISSTKANKSKKEIEINKQGFSNEEIEKEKEEARTKEKVELTEEEARQRLEQQRRRRQRDAAVSILRGISIRMPLLLYGADIQNEQADITLDRFVQMVDDRSWEEFMPKGVDKKRFDLYKRYYDEDIFSAAGRQIRSMARAADRLSVTERIQNIAQIFNSFRNPDKETVLTPWRVVNRHISDTIGGYCFYGDRFEEPPLGEPRLVDRGLVTHRVFENEKVRILEINSKSGLYPLYMAYSVFRHRVTLHPDVDEWEVWRSVLRENIFVICKTEMARSITRRTLCGFTDAKINTHVYDDLLNQITNRRSEFVSKLQNGGIFKQITKNMKFDAIVGNPPYQVMDGRGIAGDGGSMIYGDFVLISKSLSPNYISMIIPSKWMVGGGLKKFREAMISDKHIEKIFDFVDDRSIFPTAHNDGGICYFLWNNLHNGNVTYQYIDYDGASHISNRTLENDYFEFIIRDSRIIDILDKTRVGKRFSSIVSALSPYGIATPLFNEPERYPEAEFSDSPRNGHYKIYGVKGLKGGAKRVEGYVSPLFVKKVNTSVDRYKIFFSATYSTNATRPPKCILAQPKEICTATFLEIGGFYSKKEMENCHMYMQTRLFLFLLYYGHGTMHVTKEVFGLIPLQDFSRPWTDKELYEKYKLSQDEIAFIESTIKEMV